MNSRFIVFGAGAIGGLVGGRLAQAGRDVILIARGPHLDALRLSGLRIESPEGTDTVRVPAAGSVGEVEPEDRDVVLLAMKTQDTERALDALADRYPPSTPVVCLQNGVENERLALRRFERVYAVPVMCPAAHLEPGVVEASSSPVTGLLDIGRYPSGLDELAEAISSAFREATFDSIPRHDVMRWKWSKLLMNLGNAIEAACGRAARGTELYKRARAEGEAVLQAAGIDHASAEEDRERRGDLLRLAPVAGRERPGGSSWQSLARRSGRIETDWLNGEIVLLGRLHGVPTPLNAALQRLANQLAASGAPPGSVDPATVLAEAGDG